MKLDWQARNKVENYSAHIYIYIHISISIYLLCILCILCILNYVYIYTMYYVGPACFEHLVRVKV